MLSATVTVDLRHDGHNPISSSETDYLDRKALDLLDQIPDGARLNLLVGGRELLLPSAVNWLAEHSRRLHINIDAATPSAARSWYDAIKAGGLVDHL